MKNIRHAILSLVSAGFPLLLLGCSDQPQGPVAPADQLTREPASLGKSNTFTSTFVLTSLNKTYSTNEGTMWYTPGGELQMKKFGVEEMVGASDSRLAGLMKHYLSLTVDVVTGEGVCHGTFTLDPGAAADNGVWEGEYEGRRIATDVPYVFTLPLKVVGHGKGGSIDKMQMFLPLTLTVITAPAPVPPQLPIDWWGTGTATIQQH